MSKFCKALIAVLLAGTATTVAALDRSPGLGRAATAAEVKAGDIDVRPDCAGLPKGGLGNGGKADVSSVACMQECKKTVEIASALPDCAQDAHGTFAEQNRLVGQTRGKPTGAAGAQP